MSNLQFRAIYIEAYKNTFCIKGYKATIDANFADTSYYYYTSWEKQTADIYKNHHDDILHAPFLFISSWDQHQFPIIHLTVEIIFHGNHGNTWPSSLVTNDNDHDINNYNVEKQQ